jgi:integrase
MAWIRQLPSGLWAATVYTPVGRRSESFKLKGSADKWASDLEADIRRGEFIDPRLAMTTVDEIWTKHSGARRLERASRKRDESIYRNHVRPRWGKSPVGVILKPDVQEWVNNLEAADVGGWTIIAALNVLKAVLELAVDGKYLRNNPARRVQPPLPPDHVDRVLLPHEQDLLLGRLDELFPGRRDARLFVEGLLETGGRWEEVAAVKREAVNLRDALIDFGPVLERDGRIRDYPKGARSRHAAGFRSAPISREYAARLRPVVLATPPGGLVYTAPQGGPLDYSRWHDRVWSRALRAEYTGPPPQRRPGQRGPLKTPVGPLLLDDPQPTPHDLRHTMGTELADAGVPEHDRMELMGHKDARSAKRYVHSGDERFERARQARARKSSGS